MAQPDKLRRLAARTRELTEELDRARPDLLSITELNRALRHILGTQAAILEALAGIETPSAAVSRPHIRVSPALPSPSGVERRAQKPTLEPVELDPEELEDPILDLDEGVSKLPPELEKEPGLVRGGSEAPTRTLPAVTLPEGPINGAAKECAAAGQHGEGATGTTTSNAEAWLNEKRVVPGHLARQFVCQFDNRDKDYDKGLDKLNRWVSAGSSGTPFQWRGDQAYLNLSGSAAATVRNYEDQLMTRMGFSRRLGRLEVPGLEGEVMIYERPTS